MNKTLARTLKIGLLLIVFSMFFVSIYSAQPWYDNEWNTRINLTIDNTLVDSTLIDFPVFVKLNSSTLNFSKTQTDGSDILFTLENGTLLDFERIRHDTSTQQAEYFVRIPEVSSVTDTSFLMYYNNNNSPTNLENSSNVWINNFDAVWHFDENSWDGSVNEIVDSTSNLNNGQSFNGANVSEGGPIYKATDLDGINDFATTPHDTSLVLGTQVTVNALVNLDTFITGDFMGIVTKGGWDVREGYEFLIRRSNGADPNRLHWGSSNSRLVSTLELPLNSWVYITGTLSGTTGSLYLNDVLDNSGTLNSLVDNTREIYFGYRDPANNFPGYFDGQIGEVRISSIERNASWVKADFHSINNSLLTYNLEENLILPEFYDFTSNPSVLFYNGTATFNVAINNTNGTVLLEIQNQNISATNIGGNIYSANYTFNTTGNYSYKWFAYGNQTTYSSLSNSSSQEFRVVEVAAPIISFVSPTPLSGSVVSNNEQILNLSIREGTSYNVSTISKINLSLNNQTWTPYDNSLKLFMNLNNNSNLNESPINVIDHSLFKNNGIFTGNAQFNSNGRFGGSAEFDGTNDWIEVPDNESLDDMQQFSFDAWVYDSSADNQPRGIAAKRVSQSSPTYAWTIFTWNNRYVYFDIGSSGDRHNSGVSLPSNEWVHLTVTYDGNAPSTERKKFYYNGDLIATTTSSLTQIPRASGTPLTIGILNSGYGNSWSGFIDNVRIFNRTLNDSEVSFMYNSSLSKINLTNWELTYNANLETGINTISGCASDLLNQVNCTSLNTTLETISVTLLSPLNNSKIISPRNVEFAWRVNSSIPTLTCSLYVNSILRETSTCNPGMNSSAVVNLSPGVHDWYIVANASGSNSTSDIFTFRFMEEYDKLISKKIIYENTNLYRLNISLVDNVNTSSTIIDFVDTLFNSGSFSLIPSFVDNIAGSKYGGEIIGWNTTSSQNITYSVTGVNYSTRKLYMLGLE